MLRFESVSNKQNECRNVMLSHVLANESSSRIFSYINLNGFLSPLSRKNLFRLQDRIVVSSMEKYPTAPGATRHIATALETITWSSLDLSDLDPTTKEPEPFTKSRCFTGSGLVSRHDIYPNQCGKPTLRRKSLKTFPPDILADTRRAGHMRQQIG